MKRLIDAGISGFSPKIVSASLGGPRHKRGRFSKWSKRLPLILYSSTTTRGRPLSPI